MIEGAEQLNNTEHKLAVVTRSTTSPSQTFVRRHIEFLNHGNTVVVSGRYKGETVMGRPTFHYQNSRLVELVNSLGFFPAAFEQFGASAHNAKVKAFFDEQKVTHAIMEFGYVATEIGHHIINTGRPTYCMFRGNDASGMLRNSSYRRILKQILPRLSGIISVSQSLLDNLARHGISNPKAIVVPSGVNTDLFKPGKPEPGLCLSVGRMVKKKSPETMLRAFAMVADKFDLKLEIVGGGDGLPKAQRIAKELGINDRVIFSDRMRHEEVVKRMAKPMLYLQHFQTSANGDTEGMPGVIQEAMACGLPIVTTRHAGIPDHISDGENGLLVEPGDINAFANAISRLCESQQLRQKLGQTARRYAVEQVDYRISHSKIEKFMGMGHD